MIFEISIDIAIFISILLGLTIVILVTRSFLVAKGNVNILVNDEKNLLVPIGGKLLGALAENNIFLSSACGGGGTCGQCKCIVKKGNSGALPAEYAKLTRSEIKEGYRLSCQLAVKENLEIEVEHSVFGVKNWECEVVSNENVATFIKELTLKLPVGEDVEFRAGGFVQLEIPPYSLSYKTFEIQSQYKSDWERFKLFDLVSTTDEPIIRAYSMANYPAEKGLLKFNIRVATPRSPGLPPGKMSSYIFNLKKGDKLKVYGPFGEFFARDTDAEMVYIGGGAGMAPLRSHIFDLLKTKHSKRKISFWYGARSLKEVFYAEEFDELARLNPNFTWHLALSEPEPSDNWTGLTGFIHTVVLENYLKNHSAPEDCEYYMCGPPMMTISVKKMLDNLGVDPKNIMLDDFGD